MKTFLKVVIGIVIGAAAVHTVIAAMGLAGHLSRPAHHRTYMHLFGPLGASVVVLALAVWAFRRVSAAPPRAQ